MRCEKIRAEENFGGRSSASIFEVHDSLLESKIVKLDWEVICR